MKKITNLIIIDASTSMSSKTKEVKQGITSLLKGIRKDMKENKDEVKTKTIICQFSSRNTFQVLVNSSKRKNLTKNISENYVANGNTALFDAIADGFALVGKKQDGVFVNILTDGEENDSLKTTKEDVMALFAKAKKKNWGLTFMGTTEEAIQNAVSWGIASSNTYQFDDSQEGLALSNVARDMSRGVYYASVLQAKSKKDIQTTNLVQTEDEKVEVKKSGRVIDASVDMSADSSVV